MMVIAFPVNHHACFQIGNENRGFKSIAICANIKQHCQQPWQFIALGSHQVKGKRNLIDVYSVDNPAIYQNIQREPLAALIHQQFKNFLTFGNNSWFVTSFPWEFL
jgi:hypothetical protein